MLFKPSAATRGALWMVLAAASFAVFTLSARALSDTLSTFTILFIRNFLTTAMLLPWMLRAGTAALKTKRLPLFGLPAILAYCSTLLWFYVIGAGEITLGHAVALQFSLPLFTIIAAIFFLGEKVGRRRWIATIIGFAGTLVILRPGIEVMTLSAILTVASAALYAGVNISAKSLVRTESPDLVALHLSLMTLPLALIAALFDWTTPGWEDAGWLLALGVGNTAAHMCIARSFQAADASAVIPFDFLRLPFLALLGYLLYAEILDFWTWAGAAIIFASSYFIAWREARLARAKPAPGQ